MPQIQTKLHNYVKRGFLGKNDQYYLFQYIMSHHVKKNNNSVADHEIQGYIILDRIGPKFSFCLKRGNWLILLLSTYCAPSCYNVSKNTGRSWVIRCCSFGPNWTQITHLPLQGIFLKNWLLFLYASGTPSQYYNV